MTSTVCKSTRTHLDTVVTGLRFLTAAFIGHADTHISQSQPCSVRSFHGLEQFVGTTASCQMK